MNVKIKNYRVLHKLSNDIWKVVSCKTKFDLTNM